MIGNKASVKFAQGYRSSFIMNQQSGGRRLPNKTVDSTLLKEAVGQLGGRGGGQPAFAQGGGVAATIEQIKSVIEVTAAGL